MLRRTQAIVGHRGAAGLAVENTLAAVRKAAQAGAVGIEIDAQLLGDGTVVVHHDTSLGRVMLGEQSLSELSIADLDGILPLDNETGGYDERIPLLLDLLRYADEYGLAVNVEVKCQGQPAEPVVDAMLGILSDWPRQQTSLISSFNTDVLALFAHKAPDWPLGWIISEWPTDWRERLQQLNVQSLNVNYRALSREKVQAIQQAGCLVQAWTVNEPDDIQRLLSWGVDAIITDYPDRAMRLL